MCLAHFIARCTTMYFSNHINRALWDVMNGISRLVNGMGQWTWNLCHIPALVTLPHIAEIFWSYMTLLCGHSTVHITRRGSGPWRSNARSATITWLSVFRWQLQLRLRILIDALIGSLGYFWHGSVDVNIGHAFGVMCFVILDLWESNGSCDIHKLPWDGKEQLFHWQTWEFPTCSSSTKGILLVTESEGRIRTFFKRVQPHYRTLYHYVWCLLCNSFWVSTVSEKQYS